MTTLARFLLLLALCMLAPTALAAPSAQERQRARVLMDSGDARFEAKAYAEALESYRAADEIMGVPTTGLEVGRTLDKLGRLLEAREAFLKIVKYPQQADEPKPFAQAREHAARALSGLAQRIPRLIVRVVGLPAGAAAEVTLDGRVLESQRLGRPLEVDPGAHRVVGKVGGLSESRRDATVSEAQLLEVELSFVSADPAPPEAQPAVRADAPTPQRSQTSVGSKTAIWVSLGVAVAGVATGSVAGVRSLSLTSSAKRRCQGTRCDPAAQGDIDRAKTLANVSNIGFAVGALAAGVGVWRFVVYRRETRQQETARVAAHVGLAGVSLEGLF